MKQHDIEMYHTNNEGKSVMAERVIRTLKGLLWKQMTINGSQKWVKMLDEITNRYNHNLHSSIQHTPKDAYDNPEKVVDINAGNNYYNETQLVKKKPKYQVGDRVRIFKYMTKFSKGFRGYYTNEVFVVSEVIQTTPITYRIHDLDGEEIQGTFYANELQMTSF